jgi:hypothetical protein
LVILDKESKVYKFANVEHTIVNNLEAGHFGIHNASWLWEDYQKWVDAGGITEPFMTVAEEMVDQKKRAEKVIRDTFAVNSEAPVEVTIPEGTFTFNGGQDSAGYIQGATQLAQALSEPNVVITDINNVSITMDFSSAVIVATEIGKAFRTAFFVKQNSLVALYS